MLINRGRDPLLLVTPLSAGLQGDATGCVHPWDQLEEQGLGLALLQMHWKVLLLLLCTSVTWGGPLLHPDPTAPSAF